jgi:hypothetical protein
MPKPITQNRDKKNTTNPHKKPEIYASPIAAQTMLINREWSFLSIINGRYQNDDISQTVTTDLHPAPSAWIAAGTPGILPASKTR